DVGAEPGAPQPVGDPAMAWLPACMPFHQGEGDATGHGDPFAGTSARIGAAGLAGEASQLDCPQFVVPARHGRGEVDADPVEPHALGRAARRALRAIYLRTCA